MPAESVLTPCAFLKYTLTFDIKAPVVESFTVPVTIRPWPCAMPENNTMLINNIAHPLLLFLLFGAIIFLFKNKSLLQKIIIKHAYQNAYQNSCYKEIDRCEISSDKVHATGIQQNTSCP